MRRQTCRLPNFLYYASFCPCRRRPSGGWPLSGRKQPLGIIDPEERHAVPNGFIVGSLIFEVHRSTELALTNARPAVFVRGMLPVAQDEIGITGAAADPEP